MQVLNFSALSSCKVCILRAGYLFSCLSTVFLLLSSGLRNVARYLSRHNTTRDTTIVVVVVYFCLYVLSVRLILLLKESSASGKCDSVMTNFSAK